MASMRRLPLLSVVAAVSWAVAAATSLLRRRALPRYGFALAALAVGPVVASGQTTPISINSFTPYTQDFDGMGTGTPSYPAGWNGFKFGGSGTNLTSGSFITPSTNPAFTTSNGGANTGTMYNYGTTGNSDRALGSIASGTTIPGFGAVFVNETGATITDIAISFRAEQWRTGDSATADEVWQFEYRTGSESLDINDTSRTGWTPEATLNMAEIRTDTGSGSSGPIDGNADGNFTVVTGAITGVNWAPGERLALRWLDTNDAGADAGMAIDVFTFTPVPEPGAMLGVAVAGLAGFAATRRRSGGR